MPRCRHKKFTIHRDHQDRVLRITCDACGREVPGLRPCDKCGHYRKDVQSVGRDCDGAPDGPDYCFLCRKELEREFYGTPKRRHHVPNNPHGSA